MTAVDLLDILDDLGEEEFERFRWSLLQVESPKGFPNIKKGRLEKANKCDTVDLLVQTYELPGAVEVTKKVLKKIPRNDLVQRLSLARSRSKGLRSEKELGGTWWRAEAETWSEKVIMTKLDLLNTLEDLIEKEFEDFKWFLKDESLEGHQAIKASRLEKAERRDTVDLMVQTYQLPGAVEWMSVMLERLQRIEDLPLLRLKELKQVNCAHCRLRDIQQINGHLVVATDEVHLGEYNPTSQMGRKVLNVRAQVVVRRHRIIEPVGGSLWGAETETWCEEVSAHRLIDSSDSALSVCRRINNQQDLSQEKDNCFSDESLEGHQAIKASQLEKAERRDTVDLMVQTYQLPGAVEVTKKLLKKINRNDLLQSLSDSSSGPEESECDQIKRKKGKNTEDKLSCFQQLNSNNKPE
eukprot:superscaffoldBa00001146_g9178